MFLRIVTLLMSAPLTFAAPALAAAQPAADEPERLAVDLSEWAAAAAVGQPLQVRLSGKDYQLALERHDLTTADARFVAMTEHGPVERPRPHVATYRGRVLGEKSSDVRLLLRPDLLIGSVRVGGERLFLASELAERGQGQVFAYRGPSLPERPATCGASDDDDPFGLSASALEREPGEGRTSFWSPRILELALESDHELFVRLGSDVERVHDYVLGVLNVAEGYFQPEPDLALRVTFQSVWTAAPAGYPYSGTDTYAHLNAFASRGSTLWTHVRRDAAYLFLGRDVGPTGVANIGSACQADGYAASYALGLRGTPAPRFAGHIAAHEIGHLLGARHDVVPPGQSCDTLMCSGALGTTEFSTRSKQTMVRFVDGAGGCVDGSSVAPSIVVGPAAVSLGDILVGETRRQPAAVNVESLDPGVVSIRRLWFEDSQGVEDTSGDWVVEGVTPAATAPFALGPADAFSVDIAARVHQAGVPIARYLAIEASSPGHPLVKVRAAFEARGVAPLLLAMPDQVVLTSSASQPPATPPLHVRAFLIENAGYVDLQRTGFVIEGPDASHFEVIASTCGQSGSTFVSPAPATCVLPSGASEVVRVRYRIPLGAAAPPAPPALHKARVRVLSDAGEAVVNLIGNYVP